MGLPVTWEPAGDTELLWFGCWVTWQHCLLYLVVLFQRVRGAAAQPVCAGGVWSERELCVMGAGRAALGAGRLAWKPRPACVRVRLSSITKSCEKE